MSHTPPTASCRREVALNDEGAVPTELLVLPAGRIDGRDGRWWVNDDPASIVVDFEVQGIDLQIDYEHASELAEPNGQPIIAAGWITALEVRVGALWAIVNWTDRASAHIAAREYRYFSPTFYYEEDTRSILALVSIGLTNNPNFRQAALNKRGAGQAEPEPQETSMKPDARKALCRKLGLTEEASDEAIATAVEALQADRDKAHNSANTPSLERFVPRADHDKVKGERDTALNRLQEISDKETSDLVDAAVTAGKIDPASKDYHLAACRAEGGLEAFKTLVGDLPTDPVTQSSGLDGKTPPNASGTLSAEEKAMCKLTGTSHEDFLKQRDGEKAA